MIRWKSVSQISQNETLPLPKKLIEKLQDRPIGKYLPESGGFFYLLGPVLFRVNLSTSQRTISKAVSSLYFYGWIKRVCERNPNFVRKFSRLQNKEFSFLDEKLRTRRPANKVAFCSVESASLWELVLLPFVFIHTIYFGGMSYDFA